MKLSAVAAFAFAFVAVHVASAATTTITPTSLQGWVIEASAYPAEGDSGTVNFVSDTSSLGDGALQLMTPDNDNAYAQMTKVVDVPIGDVTEASYMTKTLSGPAIASAAFAFGLDTNDDGDVDKYYSYEPYYQQTELAAQETWQTWNVLTGVLWTSGTGQALVTWDEIVDANPEALVKNITVYQGTSNPNYTVNVDAVSYNGTTYDFELAQDEMQVVTNKDDCKSGGWDNLVTSKGKEFKNQGQCIAYVVSSEKSKHNRQTVTLDQQY